MKYHAHINFLKTGDLTVASSNMSSMIYSTTKIWTRVGLSLLIDGVHCFNLTLLLLLFIDLSSIV